MIKFTKKRFFDALFYTLIVLMLIPTTRAWILRQISFSPSIESVENSVQLQSYDWLLKGVNNNENIDFNEKRDKVVIINFWATWCTPCVAEMPSIQALYDDYGSKVDFILVTSEKVDKVLPFLKKHKFTLPVYNQVSQAPKEFYTETIPKTFLIDKKGNILINAGRADWNTKKIRKLLDQLIEE